jgi:DNA-binding phage protein
MDQHTSASTPYQSALLAALREREAAAAYLEAALDAQDLEVLLLALRNVAEALQLSREEPVP